MSTGFKIISVLLALACIGACNTKEEPAPKELESAGTLTAELVSTSTTTAVFDCELTVHPDAGKSLRAGIMYSTSRQFTTSSATRVLIENPVAGHHELTIGGLSFATTYYYSTYVYHLGKYELSEVKSFTTETIRVDIEPSDIQFNQVTFEGQLHLEEGQEGKVKLGFMFSDMETFPTDATLEKVLDYDEQGRFSVTVTGLDQGTTYYYKYYLSQGGMKVTAPVKTFITLSPYVAAFGDLDFSLATDLSESASANCYIVTAPGIYKFKAVKGHSDEPIGEVAIVHPLWESFGNHLSPGACDLIEATSYKDGYAAVKIPGNFKEGNALVVAKDVDGKVLWSWHFWLLSEYPGAHNYANGAGTMMDRNLGALSLEKGDPKGFGLLYQWGRKDPFPGSATLNGLATAAITGKMYATISSETEGTIDFAVQNPSTMIFPDTSRSTDWLWSSGGSATHDFTRWQSEKTIYDPCPAGWRVPDGGPSESVKQEDGSYAIVGGGIWAMAGIATGGGFPYPESDYLLAGITIPAEYCGEDVWYPAAGSISAVDGTFVDVGRDGVYWSVTPCGISTVYGFNFYYYRDNTGYVYVNPQLTQASAASVRCCRVQ